MSINRAFWKYWYKFWSRITSLCVRAKFGLRYLVDYLTSLLGYISAADTQVGKTLKRFQLEQIIEVYKS